ncbi:type II toxin-antitoxin system VapC family toxin [Methyloprofundus sp.]|uniref:type II toxin-antitoxin system VapC family toxin n=1 Tax=Methyloprofundus sp. TaxID=2020875 RepID=UPI003D1321F0
MFMLDTNICIYVLKDRPITVLKAFEATDQLHISAIVYAELWSGIEKSPLKIKGKRKEELLEFLSLITIQSWDELAGREYAKQHTYLKKNGMMIGNMDLLIASHARSLKATLITNNVHEFERVEGLKIENWV